MQNASTIWEFLQKNKHATFQTIRNLHFNIQIDNDKLTIIRDKETIFTIYKISVISAYSDYVYNKVEKPSQFSPDIMAPSYLWGLFNSFNPLVTKDDNIVATFLLSQNGIQCLEELKINYNNNISRVFNEIFINDDKIYKYAESIYDYDGRPGIKKSVRINSKVRNNINKFSNTYGVSRNIFIDHIIQNIYNEISETNQFSKEIFQEISSNISNNISSLNKMKDSVLKKSQAIKSVSNKYLKKLLVKIDKSIHELAAIKQDAKNLANYLPNGENALLSKKPIPENKLSEILKLFEENYQKIPYKERGITIDSDLIKYTLEILNDSEDKKLPLNSRNASIINTPDGLDKRIKIRRNSDLRTANIIVDELSKIRIVEKIQIKNFTTDRLVAGAELKSEWRW